MTINKLLTKEIINEIYLRLQEGKNVDTIYNELNQ